MNWYNTLKSDLVPISNRWLTHRWVVRAEHQRYIYIYIPVYIFTAQEKKISGRYCFELGL